MTSKSEESKTPDKEAESILDYINMALAALNKSASQIEETPELCQCEVTMITGSVCDYCRIYHALSESKKFIQTRHQVRDLFDRE